MRWVHHRLLALRLIEAVTAVIVVAIVMVGLAIPVEGHASHAQMGKHCADVMVSIATDCSQPANSESPGHQKHMACDASTACFVFAAADSAALQPSIRKPAFRRAGVHRLVTWIVIPPSPPPKSIIAA